MAIGAKSPHILPIQRSEGPPSLSPDPATRQRAANIRPQLGVFGLLLLAYGGLTFMSYTWLAPSVGVVPGTPAPAAGTTAGPPAMAVSIVVMLVYGLLGLAGLWFARRLGLPGIYRPVAGWSAWLARPLLIGAAAGVLLIVADRLFVSADWAGFQHPAFPLSLIGSAAAAIGEEVLFRMLVLGVWAYLLSLLLRRRASSTALVTGNVIAAIAFAAGHLPTVMVLTGAADPSAIPPRVLLETFLLNGFVGILAGWQYTRQGLVAASGVHFWADIVWHVIWPLVAVQ